jgi:hypothetical protein
MCCRSLQAFVVCALLLRFTASVPAEQIQHVRTWEQTYSVDLPAFHDGRDNDNILIPQFNPALGTLTGVQIDVVSEGGNNWDIDWDFQEYWEADFVIYTDLGIRGPGINGYPGTESRFEIFNFTWEYSQTFGFSQGDTYMTIDEQYFPETLGSFIGTGNLTYSPWCYTYFDPDPTVVTINGIAGGWHDGEITVTYTYTPAP